MKEVLCVAHVVSVNIIFYNLTENCQLDSVLLAGSEMLI